MQKSGLDSQRGQNNINFNSFNNFLIISVVVNKKFDRHIRKIYVYQYTYSTLFLYTYTISLCSTGNSHLIDGHLSCK